MTNILHIIEREEEGYEIHVAHIESGYSVVIRDTDANEFLGIARIFPTEDEALAYAEKC